MTKNRVVKFSILVLAVFLLQSFITPTNYSEVLNQDEWKILGITTVKKDNDTDEVKVKLTQGLLSSVKIKVRNAPLTMSKFEIHYRNGSKQKVWIRKNFSSNSESRDIDLKGDKRLIKKVVFSYSKKNKKSKKKPIVVLLGK